VKGRRKRVGDGDEDQEKVNILLERTISLIYN